MQKRNLALALLALAWGARAEAEWKVVSSEAPAAGAAGVVYHHLKLDDETTGESADIHLATVNPKTATLRVIDQPGGSRSDLAEAMLREGCVAGVNGGYFDPQYAPVGLVISDGRTVAPLRKARLLSGLVAVTGGRVQLLRTGEFSSARKYTTALQCGPFLVDRGRAVEGLQGTRAARRSFVAVAGPDRVAIGFCSAVTLAQMGEILASTGAGPEFKVTRALNLDGGSSSAFWFKGTSQPVSISEQKTVRNFLAVVAR